MIKNHLSYLMDFLNLFRIHSHSSSFDRNSFLLNQLSTLLNILIISYIWIYNGRNIEIVSYLIIGRFYYFLIQNPYHGILSEMIYNKLINRINLLPFPPIMYHFIISWSYRVFQNLFQISSVIMGGLILSFYLGKALIVPWQNLWVVPLLLPISGIISFLLALNLGNLAYFLKNSKDLKSFFQSYGTLATILIGAFIPLDKLPFGNILIFSPFSTLLYLPTKIFYNPEVNLFINFYTIGLFWILFLYTLYRITYSFGLKNN